MNIRRKGAGIAFTATLLASAIATIAAPLASASVAVSATPSIPRGGTSSAPATFTLTENVAACFTGNADALEIVIWDSAGANTVHFSNVTIASPGTLGATAAIIGSGPGDTPVNAVGSSNEIRIGIPAGGGSNGAVEQIIVTATISADATAATGAIIATLGGIEAGCVLGPTGIATGTLSVTNLAAGGADPAVVLTGNCRFDETNPLAGSLPANGTVSFPDTTTANVTAAGAVVPLGVPLLPPHPRAGDTQPVTLGAHSNNEGPGTLITQTVDISQCSNSIGSPGAVANALNVSSTVTTVNVGEFTQTGGTVTVTEPTSGGGGTLLNANNLTFTLSAPATGVLFSVAPTVIYTGDAAGPGTCALSVDRKSCTITGITDGAALGSSVSIATKLDVDATVPVGTLVKVTVASSLGTAINNGTVTIARVGTVSFGVAAQPTVKIGFNDQQTGVITLNESVPGFFTAGLGATNAFAICPKTGETFTRAPWAVITNAATTQLRLLNGLVAATQVAGTLIVDNAGRTCAVWFTYAASTTVAGTIQIVGSDAAGNPLAGGPANPTDGPRINVPKTAAPGSVQFDLLVGPAPAPPGSPTGVLGGAGFQVVLSNAIRAFANSLTVTSATPAPRCDPGSTNCLGGDIVITETQNGQLKPGDRITVNVLPRATTQRMDVLLQGSNTNQLPAVRSNAAESGLFVSPVGVACTPSAIFGVVVCQVAFTITQQSFGPALGKITIGQDPSAPCSATNPSLPCAGFHYVVAADAVNGPVNVNVVGTPCVSVGPVVPPALPCGPGGPGQAFDAVVTNAIIGAAPVIITTKTSAASAVGKTNNAASFSVGTKVIAVNPASNNIASIRIKVDPTLIGKSVQIQVSTKTGSSWSPFATVTTRVIGGDGYAYYYASTKVAQWLSFRGVFPASATHATSRSQTVQIHWI